MGSNVFELRYARGEENEDDASKKPNILSKIAHLYDISFFFFFSKGDAKYFKHQ